jgi:DNA-binding transcriptional LysR family regulator
LDLTELRYLDTVARLGSFSAAAEALGITQPGLTKAARRLEAEFGCRIFTRLPRGVALTPQGEALLRRTRLIEIQLKDAHEEIRALGTGAVGSLRIGAGPSWLSRALPRIVTQMAAEFPALSFRVVGGFNASLLAGLRDGELDVVVSALPDQPLDGFLVVPLTTDTLSVVARRGHPLFAKTGLRAGDTQAYPWALPGRDVLSRARLDALFRVAGLDPPHARIESDSISFIAAALHDSDMLSFATSQILMSDMQGIAALPVPGLEMTRSAGVIFRASVAATPVSTRFLEAMAALARDLGAN